MIVCALASQACLVPQSVDQIVEAPHPPPHFVLDLIPSYLLAPVLQLYRQGSADPPCHCKLELSIPYVEEDDPTITLEARWFVDYDLAVPASQRPWGAPEILTGDFNTTNTVRPLQPFDFDADKFGFFTNGVHVVEVVLAETAAFANSSTTLPNRALNPGYTAALYRFFVNVKVDADPAQPHCPVAPPSVQVCQ